MRLYLKPLLILFFLASGQSVQAQTIVISDIDDTLKVSHVLSVTDSTGNLFRPQNLFFGMSDIFNLLKASHLSNSGEIQFFYVSNALESFRVFHEQFLEQNQFPKGDLLLRPNLQEQNYKVIAIKAIIAKTHPAHLILLGDNGEHDSETYASITQQFPKLQISIFIHQVYSVNAWWEIGAAIPAGQTPYISSVDLSFHLRNLQLITTASYQNLVTKLVPHILNEKDSYETGQIAFPVWMDCSDFNFNHLDFSTSLLNLYAQKIHQRCQ